MDVIELRVFALFFINEAVLLFSDLPYKLIHTWDRLHNMFMAKYFLLSKKLNLKDKVTNFVALLGLFVSS